MTGDDLRQLLKDLGWKQADLCRRLGMAKNTVSGWANNGAPAWVGEYLSAMVGIARLHRQFIQPTKPASPALSISLEDKQRRARRAANLSGRNENI